MSLKFEIPVKTVSPNRVKGLTRGAALGHAARKKKERETARLCTLAGAPYYVRIFMEGPGQPVPRDIITLTRVSAGTLDTDNLEASLKACRDGIAQALGVDDGPSGPIWKCAQKKCKRGLYSVEVEIVSGDT